MICFVKLFLHSCNICSLYTNDYSSPPSVQSILINLDFSRFFKFSHTLFEKKGILFTGFLIKYSKYFRNFLEQFKIVRCSLF